MKVLWVEDHHRAQEMLMIAGTKAVRKRIQLDLVIAANLMEAERRIRFEKFDLVVLDESHFFVSFLQRSVHLLALGDLGNLLKRFQRFEQRSRLSDKERQAVFGLGGPGST